jgi:hypothetical protein
VRDNDKQTRRGDAASAYSLGFEMACAVAGFVLVGVWIDRHYRSGPWGTLICLVLGLIGGFYNLFRGVSRMAGGFAPGGSRGFPAAPESRSEAPRAPAAARASARAERRRPGALDRQPDTPAGGAAGRADSRDSTSSAGSASSAGSVSPAGSASSPGPSGSAGSAGSRE